MEMPHLIADDGPSEAEMQIIDQAARLNEVHPGADMPFGMVLWHRFVKQRGSRPQELNPLVLQKLDEWDRLVSHDPDDVKSRFREMIIGKSSANGQGG